MLVLYNVRMDMAGAVDFSAANARSSAQLRVKGSIPLLLTCQTFHFCRLNPNVHNTENDEKIVKEL